MKIISGDKLNYTSLVQENPCVFLGARLIPSDDDDYLVIYDSNLGPEGKIIAYLDKENQSVMFLPDGIPCSYGIYAFLPRDGEHIIYFGHY